MVALSSSDRESWGGLEEDHGVRFVRTESADGDSRVAARARKHTAGRWDETRDCTAFGARDWTISGEGDRPDSCGDYYPREFCETAGHLHWGASSCESRDCPECSSIWTARRAASIAERLGAYRHNQPDGLERRAVHAAVSAPEGAVRSKEDVARFRKKAYELAKDHGVRGGCAIFHGYRIREDALDVYRAEKELDRHDKTAWRWVREHERDWRELVYWSPHVHVLGVCEDFEAASDREDGYVVRNIRSLKPFQLTDPDGYTDMVAAARYVMSHATYDSTKSGQAVRWFGELAPAAFGPEAELSAGAWATIQRKVADLVGASDHDDRAEEAPADDDDDDAEGTCERDGCEGELRSIFVADEFLQHGRNCERIGPEAERRLLTAYRWVMGELKPPPGLKGPNRTEDAAREVFEHLL